jgi:hypothetical protein
MDPKEKNLFELQPSLHFQNFKHGIIFLYHPLPAQSGNFTAGAQNAYLEVAIPQNFAGRSA